MYYLLNKLSLKGDRTIWAIVFILTIISILVVYSIEGTRPTLIHLRNIIIGLFCMYFVHKLKFKYFSKLSLVSMFISILLLIFVYFIGREINGATRWIVLGGLSFQPSDFSKLVLLIFVSRQISKYREYLHEWKGILWYVLAPTSLICFLILPSNFSTAALTFLNVIILMFFAKIHYKFLFGVIIFAFSASSFIYLAGKHVPVFQDTIPRSLTWVSRVDSYFSPQNDYDKNQGYQLNEAKILIYDGKLIGQGAGKKNPGNFLYSESSDFVIASIINQYGSILGGVILLFLYLLFFYRSIIVAHNTDSMFGMLMVSSLSCSILMQAMINISMPFGILPVTGQTLPLISKGGTSIIFTCIAIGIILSVSRDSKDRDYEKA